MPRSSDLSSGNKVQWNRVLPLRVVKLIERLAAVKGMNEASLIGSLVIAEARRENLKDA